MKTFILCTLGVLNCSFFVSAKEVDPQIVLAIAQDLDDVVGDTVDEGEWDADIKRDSKKFPVEYSCLEKTTHRGPLYICNFTFVVTPYSNDFADGNAWETECSNLLYFVPIISGKLSAQNFKDSVQGCIEDLSETPY